VVFAVAAALLEFKASYSFSVIGFCYLLSLLVAFVAGRMVDCESQEFRFLALWPQSRGRVFAARLLSHLLLAAGTIVALYLIAVAAMLLTGQHFGSLEEESIFNPTGVSSISLICLVFAFSAFWSQFAHATLSLLMTLISVIALRFWIAAGVETAFYWRTTAGQYLSKGEVFERMRLWHVPAWMTLALALCVVAAAAVGFVRVPLLEVKRRAFWSTAIVMAVLAVLGLLFSLDSTNWLGFSEARYDAVQLGMNKAQVFNILGRPHDKYLRSGLGKETETCVSPVAGTGVPPGGADAARANADEVWRWWHPIDQKIGVVFDKDGRVIYKWVDY